jgi:hypothetical protein
MTPDDPRARFVLAQYLIENDRLDEARLLLLGLTDYPIAQKWINQIEAGEPVNTDEFFWEADRVRPMPTPPQLPPFKPGKAIVALLMALTLFLPVIQMITFSRAPAAADSAEVVTGEARLRLQRLCEAVVSDAIADGRLLSEVGSCLDWSLRVTERQMRQVTRCHDIAGTDARLFYACVVDADIYPDGVLLPGVQGG